MGSSGRLTQRSMPATSSYQPGWGCLARLRPAGLRNPNTPEAEQDDEIGKLGHQLASHSSSLKYTRKGGKFKFQRSKISGPKKTLDPKKKKNGPYQLSTAAAKQGNSSFSNSRGSCCCTYQLLLYLLLLLLLCCVVAARC